MEEVVGKLWDKWLTQQLSTEHFAAKVDFNAIQAQLLLFYRAMGGKQGKTIEIAATRTLHVKRSALQKIAGSQQKFFLSWQDQHSVRLPPSIAIFSDKSLNKMLYFWLVALAAKMPIMNNWLQDNQTATAHLISTYPGLKRSYLKLMRAFLASRPEINHLALKEQQSEKQIQNALRYPGIITTLKPCKYDLLPIYLWLYPAQTSKSSDVNNDNNLAAHSGQRHVTEIKELPQKKQAEYVDDQRKTDGLLVFQAEALTTWIEQVNLDRCQSEDDNDNTDDIANDLDIITLSRQRKAKAARIRFSLDLPAAENDDLRLGEGIALPEWNFKQQRLIAKRCLLQTMLADEVKPVAFSKKHQQTGQEILQLFAVLGLNRQTKKRQAAGDEIDLDAWLDDHSQPIKDGNKQNYFIDNSNKFRDVSCLILADLSLSTEGHINNEQRVIDIIRDSLLIFAEALNKLNDEFAIYGFSSVRSQHVRYHILKNFNMLYDAHVRGRITNIEPGYYTRMGAAIRQSSTLLTQRESSNKILLLITDGRPNDLDQYEGRYGIEDTRQAIIEAKLLGLTPHCVTIDKQGHDYLPYLFGHNCFSVINNAEQLPKALAKIYLNLTTH
jgi:nitric oxide reductase NorD protein